jgi:signal transduction histidine kinase
MIRRFRLLAATTVFRWTLAIAGGFVLMALFLFAFIYWETAVREQARVDDIVNRGARAIADAPAADVVHQLESWLELDGHAVRFAGLFGPDSSRLAGNLGTLPGGLVPDGVAREAVFDPVSHDHDDDDPEVVRGVAERLPDGRLLVLGYDIDEVDEVQGTVLRALGLGLLPAALLSLLSGTLLAHRGQRRIVAMHEATGRIRQGQLRERLPTRGTQDELDKLAAAVNGMLDEIERLVEDIRGVGDNIAHDLRTPLTRVRARLERSRDEARTREEFQAAADRAIDSIDQALAVVAALLRIGEIEHGRRLAAFASVDLADILQDAAELYEPVAEEKEVTLRLAIDAVRPVPGDRDLLLEAVGNLVDNAVKFAPPKTEVILGLARGPDGPCLSITDHGPGIPLAERERVLQRFYRVEKSRTVEGSGLGLSLVAAVVALHSFRLSIGGDPGCVIEIACTAAPAGASVKQTEWLAA